MLGTCTYKRVNNSIIYMYIVPLKKDVHKQLIKIKHNICSKSLKTKSIWFSR